MKVLPYHLFVQIPANTPYIPLDTTNPHQLCLFEKAINNKDDFYFRSLDTGDDLVEEHVDAGVGRTAGGMLTGSVPDEFDTVSERDGMFDQERSFLVLDTVGARLSYLENVSELLNLHNLSDDDKKKVIEGFANFVTTGVKTEDNRDELERLDLPAVDGNFNY